MSHLRTALCGILVACSPTPPAAREAAQVGGLTAGTRLIIQAVTDGKNVLPFGLFDSLLGEACVARTGNDGVVRCAPAWAERVYDTSLYSDASCQDKVVYSFRELPYMEKSFASSRYVALQGPGRTVTYFKTKQELVQPADVFFLGPLGTCEPSSTGTTEELRYFALDDSEQSERFVSFTRSADEALASADLRADKLVADDGAMISARAPNSTGFNSWNTGRTDEDDGIRVVDGAGQPCTPTLTTDDVYRCVPGEKGGPWFAGYTPGYGDASCGAPTALFWAAYPEVPTHVAFAATWAPRCVPRVDVFGVGAVVSQGFEWSYQGPAYECVPSEAPPGRALVGPLDLSAFAPFERSLFPTSGAGRLFLKTATSGPISRLQYDQVGSHSVPTGSWVTQDVLYGAAMFDSKLGIDCVMADARDGTFRCLPRYVGGVHFLDDACTEAVFQESTSLPICPLGDAQAERQIAAKYLDGNPQYYEVGGVIETPVKSFLLSQNGDCELNTYPLRPEPWHKVTPMPNDAFATLKLMLLR